jgi:hypothetical protein
MIERSFILKKGMKESRGTSINPTFRIQTSDIMPFSALLLELLPRIEDLL